MGPVLATETTSYFSAIVRTNRCVGTWEGEVEMAMQGSAAMPYESEKAGTPTRKATLRSDKVQVNDLPGLTAGELVQIRNELRMSRAVFAKYLRTNARTLEGWEQGRARPNAQAVTLIRLVQKHPETVKHLAALS